MTTTDGFEWPQNDPLFDLSLSLIAEGIGGNGILSTGDLQVTATANTNEIQVAAGTLFYGGTVYSEGSASTFTLSSNSSGSDRWDLVYYDTSTPGPAVREGTAAAEPEPPALQSGEWGIAYVYVADGETDVTDSEIKNWRTFALQSDAAYVPDSKGLYSGDTVESALQTELEPASKLTSYPLPIGDLNSPYGLPNITDMDAAGNDLSDSAGPGVIYDASAGVVLQGVLGGPASSLTSYPLPLGSDTDGDLSGNDLSDSAGPGTLYDASAGEFPRGVLDDEKTTTVVSSSTYTTSDEELILVDTSAIAGTSTITLASADVEQGHGVVVVDLTGTAGSGNSITIDTESSETINGGSSITIDKNYGARRLETDGTNWVTAGGGSGSGSGVTNETVAADESGTVSAGNLGTVFVTEVPDGSSIEFTQAYLTLADGQPAPSGVDLIIATLAGDGTGTSQTTLISGDGSTVFADEEGTPLGSYTNSTGSAEVVALGVDNGNFNSGSGSSQDVAAGGIGEVV
jgi:hypothetical protein